MPFSWSSRSPQEEVYLRSRSSLILQILLRLLIFTICFITSKLCKTSTQLTLIKLPYHNQVLDKTREKQGLLLSRSMAIPSLSSVSRMFSSPSLVKKLSCSLFLAMILVVILLPNGKVSVNCHLNYQTGRRTSSTCFWFRPSATTILLRVFRVDHFTRYCLPVTSSAPVLTTQDVKRHEQKWMKVNESESSERPRLTVFGLFFEILCFPSIVENNQLHAVVPCLSFCSSFSRR